MLVVVVVVVVDITFVFSGRRNKAINVVVGCQSNNAVNKIV